MAAGPLRKRIRRILQLEDDPMLVSGKSLVIVLASLLVAATLAVLYLPAIGQAEESTTQQQEPATEDAVSTESDPPIAASDDEVVELSATEFEKDLPAGLSVTEANGETSHVEQVLATVPDPISPWEQLPEKLIAAISEANKNNIYVDLVKRGNEWALVTVPRPTERNWPQTLGDPPRKNRVIADKAWQRLGLKLIPASTLETWLFHLYGIGGPIKILGGNVPKGLPVPVFMRQIGDQEIHHFDQLHKWLGSEIGQTTKSVKVYAFADGNEYLFEAEVPGGTAPSERKLATAHTASQKFPSLEEQKLADLAWKRLGLELEPIGDEDRQRVRSRGYDGGLKIVGGHGDMMSQDKQIAWNDVLVGLHVWPTTSLKDVAQILAREDLDELNPLKFYVVRPTGVRVGTPQEQNAIISGRIRVGPDENQRPPRPNATTTPLPMPWEDSPSTGTSTKPGSMKTQVTKLDSSATADEINKAIEEAGISAEGPVQVELAPQDSGSALVIRGPDASNREPRPNDPFFKPPQSFRPQAATRPHPGPDGNKRNLRYEGKTFDEWRDAWQTELSTQKRLEAVKALTAFGANGYGPEAAEAILAIAKNYDWESISPGSNSNRVQNAVLSAFVHGGDSMQSIPAKDWFPLVIEGIKANDKRIQQLAHWVLRDANSLRGDLEFATKSLLELTHMEPRSLRRDALVALAAIDRRHTNPRVVARLQELLEGDDVEQLEDALNSLSFANSPLPFDASSL
jgi:hypothetical protein